MIAITNKQECSGCAACANICPKQCISMQPDTEGFAYPQVDKTRCVDCHACEKLCPRATVRPDSVDTLAYAAKATSTDLRLASSSGGLFTLLAECILRKGGMVYGAAFDANAGVEHARITDAADLDKLRRSKYMQSCVGDSYRQVRDDLEQGLWVLFTGTPCQIGGLRNFLGSRDYERLICQDIICHGVPSRKLWLKHIGELGFSGDVDVNFREKTGGWHNYDIRLRKGDHLYKRFFLKDAYGRAFISDIMLRPSCYHCKYKQLQYRSDITLADFWGIEEVLPEFADEIGVSLVLVHTTRGADIFQDIELHMESRPVDVGAATRGNRPAIEGARAHRNRSVFFAQADALPFDRLVEKYVRGSFLIRVLRFAKRKMGQIFAKMQ